MSALVSWLNSNAGAVTALATIVLAIVTTFYVLLTRSISKAMRGQVDATLQEVEATRQEVGVTRDLVQVSQEQLAISNRVAESAVKQAEASQLVAEEAQRSRVATHLPVVVPGFGGSISNRLKVWVTNHGAGPALDLRVRWIHMLGPHSVSESGKWVSLWPSLATGEGKTSAEISVQGNAAAALGRSAPASFAFHSRYFDINGGEYESKVFNNRLYVEGLNEQARFALGAPFMSTHTTAS